MNKRKLGNIGTTVSSIGIGAMSFADFYGKTDTKNSHAILTTALDLGIDHLDTSNIYGRGISEERIGAFLAKQGSDRHTLFKIATKAGIAYDEDGKTYYDNSPEHLAAELDKSLQRLGVDQVELFYVHRRDQKISIEEVTKTLAGFIKSGKIRQFGFSEIAPTSLARAAKIHPVGAVQSEYSLSTRLPEMGVVQQTAALETSLVAFSPIGRSLLTDKPHSVEKIATMPFMKVNPRFNEPNLSRNIEATSGFRDLARDMGIKASTLAISWLLHQGQHILPIPGTRSTEHLQELAKGVEIKLSATDLEEIDHRLPIGWAHGARYSKEQSIGPETYC